MGRIRLSGGAVMRCALSRRRPAAGDSPLVTIAHMFARPPHHRPWLLALAVAITSWLALPARAVPELTESQRAQLGSAKDHSELVDESAWYPLLDNAMRWDDGDEAFAMVPGYKALVEDPARYRGELFLIEGRLAAAPRKFPEEGRRPLLRPGPWEDRLQWWPVLVEEDPDRLVLVYLVDPPDPQSAPRVGQRVRIAARYYKMLAARDLKDQMTSYLVFVGHGVSGRVRSNSDAGDSAGSSSPASLFVVVALLAAFYYFFVRRFLKMSLDPKPLASRRRRNASREREEASDDHDGDDRDRDDQESDPYPPLPTDPGDALSELERRKDAPAATPDTHPTAVPDSEPNDMPESK